MKDLHSWARCRNSRWKPVDTSTGMLCRTWHHILYIVRDAEIIHVLILMLHGMPRSNRVISTQMLSTVIVAAPAAIPKYDLLPVITQIDGLFVI